MDQEDDEELQQEEEEGELEEQQIDQQEGGEGDQFQNNQQEDQRDEEQNLQQIERDLEELFFQLRTENQGQRLTTDKIDKKTLMALILYLKLDQSEDEKDQVFFKALKRGIEDNDDDLLQELDQETFKNLFINPQLTYQNLNSDELACAFKIFDKSFKGSFSAEDFLELYKETEDYQQSTQEQQEKEKQSIQKDFEIITQGQNEITPIEFYDLVKYGCQQVQKQQENIFAQKQQNEQQDNQEEGEEEGEEEY